MTTERLFDNHTPAEFEALALEIYRYQYVQNPVYREFCDHLKQTPKQVGALSDIPCLPISFFKTHAVVCKGRPPRLTFMSSGTTGMERSKHYVLDKGLYEQSFFKAFERFYGAPSRYAFLFLLPSYQDQPNSSLIYMTDRLAEKAVNKGDHYYHKDFDRLAADLEAFERDGVPAILLGVSYALLDFSESHSLSLKNTIVMETGGMKGRREELIRKDLHHRLRKAFGVEAIHSEYGMCELLSQAYAPSEGIFQAPPWMKALPMQPDDPLAAAEFGQTARLNIIDLANLYSCAFIATQDLGKVYENGSFEALGRTDFSDIRGCNLMADF